MKSFARLNTNYYTTIFELQTFHIPFKYVKQPNLIYVCILVTLVILEKKQTLYKTHYHKKIIRKNVHWRNQKQGFKLVLRLRFVVVQ